MLTPLEGERFEGVSYCVLALLIVSLLHRELEEMGYRISKVLHPLGYTIEIVPLSRNQTGAEV